MKRGDVVFLKRGLTKEFINSKRMEVSRSDADESYLESLFNLKDKNVVITGITTINKIEVAYTGSLYLFPLNFFTVNNSKQIFLFEDEI